MRLKRWCIWSLFSCLSITFSFAQKNEIGASGGISYYLGDINPTGHFKNFQNSYGVVYRRNVSTHLSLRAFYNRIHVQAYDNQSRNQYQIIRNLHFDNRMHEGGGVAEFNFWAFQPGDVSAPFSIAPRERIVFFLFGGMSVFYHQPNMIIDGEFVDLHGTNTEAKIITEELGGIYSKVQVGLPFGAGFKINLIKRVILSFEWGMRATFTDYIDDVGGVYPNRDILQNSGYAGALLVNDLSLNTTPATRDLNVGRQRGFIYSRDWFNYTNATLTIMIDGKQKYCTRFKKKMYYRF